MNDRDDNVQEKKSSSSEAEPSSFSFVGLLPGQILGLQVATHATMEWFSNEAALVEELLPGTSRDVSEPLEDPQAAIDLRSLVWRVNSVNAALENFPRSTLTTMVTVFDTYVSRLMHSVFLVKASVLNSSERKLTYSQLMGFESLGEARAYLASKEVESVLRESHEQHFRWFEKRLGIKTVEGLDRWGELVEVFERRNLFVHADGLVSSTYRDKCLKAGLDSSLVPDIGGRLSVDPGYLQSSADLLIENGVKLGQVVWRKLCPEEIDEADDVLVGVTFELLSRKRYLLAERLLEFALDLPRHGSESTRLIHLINLSQSKKWLGKEQECLDLLGREEWASRALHFQLSAAVLRAEFETAAKVLEDLVNSDSVQWKKNLATWPLFRDWREWEGFEQLHERLFGELPVGRASGLIHTESHNSLTLGIFKTLLKMVVEKPEKLSELARAVQSRFRKGSKEPSVK